MNRLLAAMLHVEGRNCLVVGGGGVAARRARLLCDAGARVYVVAPDVCEEIHQLPGVHVISREFEPDDVSGVFLAIAATDDPKTNEKVDHTCREHGVLVNRSDAPDQGDVLVPAQGHRGPVTLAVHTGGVSAQAAAAIRDELLAALPEEWITLLTIAGPYRKQIQQRIDDPAERQKRLRGLTDATAMGILKEQGEAALRAHCEQLVTGPDDSSAR